jgi:hypothetical protein
MGEGGPERGRDKKIALSRLRKNKRSVSFGDERF